MPLFRFNFINETTLTALFIVTILISLQPPPILLKQLFYLSHFSFTTFFLSFYQGEIFLFIIVQCNLHKSMDFVFFAYICQIFGTMIARVQALNKSLLNKWVNKKKFFKCKTNVHVAKVYACSK